MKLFFQDSGYFNHRDKYNFTLIHRDFYNDKLDILKDHNQVLCLIKFTHQEDKAELAMEIF